MKKLFVIVGPTASGKTSLSIELAKIYDGEIVSADSMQIYRGMNIATAKPTEEEMQGIKHHLIGFLDADQSYSVGKYVDDAKDAVEDIISRDKFPILCGGTGLYIDSFLNGIEFIDNSSDPDLRAELNKIGEEKGIDSLLNILLEIDPYSYRRLFEERNQKRIVRAIEFYKTTGITITKQIENSKSNDPEYNYMIFGLKAFDRQFLYDRINKRVDIMVKNGLVEEAEKVLKSDLSETASKAIGYKQLKPYFEGAASLEECIDRIKTETRHYAKRQLTWFRRNNNINWINIDELKSIDEQIDYIKGLIDNRGFLNG
ncbi:MAG: tRNA (adenosine(37)-N6)-dimethylallyltransferase MiaA [Ruminococcus sp.]|nr:tRNA (adenosine(37)-N6)-dimethylallyltransferase MiaA [Ruminococcus sp.]